MAGGDSGELGALTSRRLLGEGVCAREGEEALAQRQGAVLPAAVDLVLVGSGEPAKGALGQLPQLHAQDENEDCHDGESPFPSDFCRKTYQ